MGIDQSLNDPNFFAVADYHAALRELRHNYPVHWGVGRHGWGFWSITRYEDCQRVYRDAEAVLLVAGDRSADQSARRRTNGGGVRQQQDDDHDRPAASQQGAPGGQEMVYAAGHRKDGKTLSRDRRELIDGAAERGSCDRAADLAARMPTAVICEMLGGPGPTGAT